MSVHATRKRSGEFVGWGTTRNRVLTTNGDEGVELMRGTRGWNQRGVGFVGMLAALLLAVVLGTGSLQTAAQDATPAADEGGSPARPGHIHAGSCGDNLGDIVAPLNNLTEPEGDRVGQANRALMAETSFTNVPLPLDAIVAEDHSINIHLSEEEIGTYIACGEIGGVINETGSLVIGLEEESNSGFTGIAFLSPGADGASTDVSVFIAETASGGGGRGGATDDAEATPVA